MRVFEATKWQRLFKKTAQLLLVPCWLFWSRWCFFMCYATENVSHLPDTFPWFISKPFRTPWNGKVVLISIKEWGKYESKISPLKGAAIFWEKKKKRKKSVGFFIEFCLLKFRTFMVTNICFHHVRMCGLLRWSQVFLIILWWTKNTCVRQWYFAAMFVCFFSTNDNRKQKNCLSMNPSNTTQQARKQNSRDL